tara:strand:+ start:2573 stop:2794 length:222 start_codon:yes stop_codon:yes gene_type:complete
MKKVITAILLFILYLIFWWIQSVVAIGLNFAFFNRGAGGITAVGSLIAFWTSFKIVKIIHVKISRNRNDRQDQ